MSKRQILGGAVKAIRVAKKIPGGQFATTCLMSHAHLCNIEAGRKNPPENVIHRIAAHLGVDVGDISYVVPQEVAS